MKSTAEQKIPPLLLPSNLPKKAINPYLDPAEVAPVSALSNLITLYAADNEQEQLRREALSNEVWDRYFFNESRDPVQREMEQDRLISRAKMAREQQRFNPDLVILADVSAETSHISKPLLERIKYFEGWASRRHIPAIYVKPSGRALNAWSACVPARFLRHSVLWRATTGWRACWFCLK